MAGARQESVVASHTGDECTVRVTTYLPMSYPLCSVPWKLYLRMEIHRPEVPSWNLAQMDYGRVRTHREPISWEEFWKKRRTTHTNPVKQKGDEKGDDVVSVSTNKKRARSDDEEEVEEESQPTLPPLKKARHLPPPDPIVIVDGGEEEIAEAGEDNMPVDDNMNTDFLS